MNFLKYGNIKKPVVFIGSHYKGKAFCITKKYMNTTGYINRK